ncbi:MAG: hypothetical protein H8E14_18250 [Candidatus Marinimicrobia bacterium]|nr:hypothetical protein [Candidatus Neomarinimicrobiota bacterium]
MRQVLPFNDDCGKAQQELDDLEKVLLNACSDENTSVAKQAFEAFQRLQEKRWNKLAEPDSNKFLPLAILSGVGDSEENRIMGAMFDQWQRHPDVISNILDELHNLLLEYMDEKPEVFSYDVDSWAVTAGVRIDSPSADARIFTVEVMEDISVTDGVSIQIKAYCLSQIVNAKVWKGKRDERLSAAQSVTNILAAVSDIKGMIKLLEESGVRQLADALIDTLQDVDNLGEIWSTALSALEQMISHSIIPPSRYAGIISALDNVLTNLDEKKVSEKVVLMLRLLSERGDVPGSNKERARSRLLDAAVTSERDEQILALEAIEKTKLSSRLRRRMIEDLVVLRKTEAELVGQIDRTLLAHNYSVRKEKTKKYAIIAGGVIAGAIAGQILAKIDVIINLLGKLINKLF